jgi:DNA-binding MarR family transcriptional regulator
MGDNLTDKERATLTALGRATAAFRDLSMASMPTSCVAAFCQIATGEGRTVSEHARTLDMGLMAMSRTVQDMGGVNRYGGAGLGLVETRTDLNDRRNVTVSLSAKAARSLAR